MDGKDNDKQTQRIDIDVEGNVSGDIHIDRHDTHVDQSVTGVTAKGDAVIATGDAKITLIKVIPSWVWIVIFLVIFGSAGGFWGYRYLKIEKLKEDLKFNQEEVGILVANFAPVSETQENKDKEVDRGRDFAHILGSNIETLGGKTIGETKVVVKTVYPEIKPYLLSQSEAEEIGTTYGATIVIWGRVSMPGGGKETISSKIRPIKYEEDRYDRYDLNVVDPQTLREVEFKSSPETIEKDIEKLIFFILGYIQYMQAKDEQDINIAIQDYFEKALGSGNDENDAYTHFYMGNAYYYSQNVRKAEEEYGKAVQLKKDFMEAYNNLGLIAFNENRLDEALKNFEFADKWGKCSEQINAVKQESSLNPGCAHLIYNLGAAYREKGEYEKAVEYYQQSLKAFERIRKGVSQIFLVKVYNDIGYSYVNIAQKEQITKNYEEAEEYLHKAMTILEKELASSSSPPKSLIAERARINRNFGRVYLGLKDWDHALEHIEKAREDDDKSPKVYLLFYQLYDGRCQEGDEERARDAKILYIKLDVLQSKGKWSANKLTELKNTCNR